MKIYHTDDSSKIWGGLVIIVGFLYFASISYVMMYTDNYLSMPIIVISFLIMLIVIYNGFNEIIRKISVGDDTLTYNSLFANMTLKFSSIKDVEENSQSRYFHHEESPWHRSAGKALKICYDDHTINIKDINHFIDYKKLYAEIEKNSKVKINKEKK